MTTYYVGLDIAAATFVACVLETASDVIASPTTFENGTAGFAALEKWLTEQGLTKATTIVCMEATGVYSEGVAYHLSAQEWWVAVAPPLQVKRAFDPVGHKTDAVDSRQIAEYAARFQDKLRPFVPRPAILEQIKVLLQLREQFVKEKTAHLNAQKALRRKVVRTPLAEALHQQSIAQLKDHIKTIEAEIRQLFDQDPDLRSQITLLLTIPGVGLLLASHLLVLIDTLKDPFNPRVVAAHLGLVPFQHTSGTSVQRRPKSRQFGPATARKLLHLAARSRRTHHPASRQYFERKQAAGKPSRLILNNMANRLVRVMCAVLRNRRPFHHDYLPISPQSLSTP